MRARPEVRDALIASRIKRWRIIALNPTTFTKWTVGEARRNYWRLCKRYPEIMKKLGFTEASVC